MTHNFAFCCWGRASFVLPRTIAWLAVCLILASGTGLLAQEPMPETKPPATGEPPPPMETPAQFDPSQPTLAGLDEFLQKLDADEGIPKEEKEKLKATYEKVRSELKIAEDWVKKRQALEAQSREAPREIEVTQQILKQESPKITLPKDASLEDLEKRKAEAEALLRTAREEANLWKNKPIERSDRRAELPKQISTAKTQLEEVQQQLQAPPPKEESPRVIQAQKAFLLARQQALQAQIAANEAELLYLEATEKLVPLRQDSATRDLNRAEQLVSVLEEKIKQKRQAEAERQLKQEIQQKEQYEEPVQAFAEKNIALARLREGEQGLPTKIAQTATLSAETTETLNALSEELKNLRQREEKVGLTYTLGLILRNKRGDLPSTYRLNRNLDETQQLIIDVQLQLIELSLERSDLTEVEIHRTAQKAAAQAPEADREEIVNQIEDLLHKRRDRISTLVEEYNEYLDNLVQLSVTQEDLLAKVNEFESFIAERILWIRSAEPIAWSDIPTAVAAAGWFLSPGNWQDVVSVLWTDIERHPAAAALFGLGFVILLLIQQRLRRRLKKLGDKAAQRWTHDFIPTIWALCITAVIALTAPVVIWFLSWRLTHYIDAPAFVLALGGGLNQVGWVVLTTEAFRQICRPKGLAEAHFGMSAASLARWRFHLRWFMSLLILTSVIVFTLETQSDETYADSLGRLAFVIQQIGVTIFLYLVLHPSTGLVEEYIESAPDGWLRRLRFLWFPLVVGIPGFFAMLSIVGYNYTAVRISYRLIATIWYILGLVVANAMVLRWFLVTRRKLAFEEAQQRRLANQGNVNAPQQPELRLDDIDAQSRSLLASCVTVGVILGCWIIWDDTLPAIEIFRQVPLWSTQVETLAETTTAEGTSEVKTVEKTIAITLADLVMAGLVGLLAWTIGRNIPGLLEIALLRHLPLDAGARYAITTLSRYIVTVAGLALVLSLVGIRWSQVQWLVAAVGVGLGFGLQEIFANFVSGIILLFERPIRPGDTVTVGEITGTVSRIRIRATTIIGWDRKELVVPNKEFITSRVINWTLNDTITRVRIEVGVAYGSNTQQVYELLLKVAQEHPVVLPDPKPVAFFEGFGDSTLNFTMFVFIPSLAELLQTQHEINQRIDQEFRAAGIEIAFPQRDLHIRSSEPRIRIQQESTASQGNGHAASEASSSSQEYARPE